MKKRNFLFLTLLWLAALAEASAQREPFTNCAAAFLDGKLVVDDYSPTGKCMLASTTSGQLTVCTADLSPERSVPVEKIKFKVAIRDAHSKTLIMYSDETYKQVDIQKIMSSCKKGDHIVLLTMDNQYALPHNEILVQ
jgi:hypothetical protein